MATQPTTPGEQRKSETERAENKEIEVTRAGGPALERYRPRSWFNWPRFMRRNAFTPYEPFSNEMSANPFELMRRMVDDMDRMFSDVGFPIDVGVGAGEGAYTFYPDIEVFQRGDDYVIRADLPGMSKEDLRVEVVDNNLIVEGERRHELERKGLGYYRTERSYGSFRRTIPLPEGARDVEPTASYDAGVLEIRVKNPQSRGKRIEIRGGEQPKIH